jgi:phage shock protein A
MRIAEKISLALRAKAQKALDRMEDPLETLDYSYQEQVEFPTTASDRNCSAQ